MYYYMDLGANLIPRTGGKDQNTRNMPTGDSVLLCGPQLLYFNLPCATMPRPRNFNLTLTRVWAFLCGLLSFQVDRIFPSFNSPRVQTSPLSKMQPYMPTTPDVLADLCGLASLSIASLPERRREFLLRGQVSVRSGTRCNVHDVAECIR